MSRPEIIVAGTYLSSLMSWGDLEWSTCWPGGTESISFSVARSHKLFRPDALVEVDYGGIRRAIGALVEPSRGEPLMAEGLHRKGEDEPALEETVHESVDAAIAAGLPWLRGGDGITSPFDLSPEPTVNGVPDLDPDQPHSIAQFLDASATYRGQQWGVNPYRYVFMTGWSATTLHMLPGVEGLARTRDGYASRLYARFLDETDGLWKTASSVDAAAEARWGRVPKTLTEPLGEGVPMDGSRALQILDGILARGKSQMGWATPLEVQHGDVVTEYGQPVDLNTIYARQTIRLHGLDLDVADLSGRNWVDVPIARTHHKDGMVTIEPRKLSSPMNDALAGVSAAA